MKDHTLGIWICKFDEPGAGADIITRYEHLRLDLLSFEYDWDPCVSTEDILKKGSGSSDKYFATFRSTRFHVKLVSKFFIPSLSHKTSKNVNLSQLFYCYMS